MVTTPVLYEVPLILERLGAGDYVLNRLGLQAAKHLIGQVGKD